MSAPVEVWFYVVSHVAWYTFGASCAEFEWAALACSLYGLVECCAGSVGSVEGGDSLCSSDLTGWFTVSFDVGAASLEVSVDSPKA